MTILEADDRRIRRLVVERKEYTPGDNAKF
jgi:hypothetical protein